MANIAHIDFLFRGGCCSIGFLHFNVLLPSLQYDNPSAVRGGVTEVRDQIPAFFGPGWSSCCKTAQDFQTCILFERRFQITWFRVGLDVLHYTTYARFMPLSLIAFLIHNATEDMFSRFLVYHGDG